MRVESVDALFAALDRGNVRYLVVGGLAVAAHGYLRFTKDVDLVVELEPGNVRRAFAALESVGYRPQAPVTADAFADAETRESWIRDKNMVVLAFWSDLHRETPVDVFVREPFDFDEQYRRALVKELRPGLAVRFVERGELVRLKREAGRPQDLADADQLALGADDDEP
jgi:hypothetical protein